MCEIDIGHSKYTTFSKFLFNFLSLKVFRHEERDTQSFYADCFYIVSSQPNQCMAPVAQTFVWPRPALNLDSLVRRQELNSLLFLKSPNPQTMLPVCDVTHIPWSHFPSGFFYFEISELHILSVRAWTPALMLHLTNPCAKRKALSRKARYIKRNPSAIILQMNTSTCFSPATKTLLVKQERKKKEKEEKDCFCFIFSCWLNILLYFKSKREKKKRTVS